MLQRRAGTGAEKEEDDLRAGGHDVPDRLDQYVFGSERPSTELIAAWVQFLREHVADAVNGLNNRLAAISGFVRELSGERLSDAQRQSADGILEEVRRASNITQALMSRVTSKSPDEPPPAWNVLEEASVSPGHILVVEDDDSNRAVMARLFRKLGHRVTLVSDGVEARKVMENEDVDCIICDLHMPTLGGQAFYEQISESSPHLAGRFVFVTGDYTRPESHAFLKRTGQPVVGKPYELDDLTGAVAQILSKVPAEAKKEGEG